MYVAWYLYSDAFSYKKFELLQAKTLVYTYKSTWHHIPEQHCHIYCHDNLKSHME